MVSARVSGKLCDVYHLYVDELSKVLRLLLMLASRVARADTALAVTTDDSDHHRVITRIPLCDRFFYQQLSIDSYAAKSLLIPIDQSLIVMLKCRSDPVLSAPRSDN